MPTWAIVLIIVLAVILAALVALMIFGSKMQKKSEKAQADMMVGAQTYSILVIDKKMMKLSEAGFPQVVVDQTPKYLRRSKVPVVKAKIGPRVLSCMCDAKIFDLIPVKKEVKALMNGIYIIDVKGLRSGLDTNVEKKGFFARLRAKAGKKLDEANAQKAALSKESKKKNK
ncbi:MAG: hypothetical protein K6B75_06085 [Lachnospiraceae bacterium]|nr:hypothetical protein [Lachnospiraceae bacterium]